MAGESALTWARPDRFLWSSLDEKAPIAIFGVPLDETTSFRPGTRFGPSAARRASHALELYSLRQKRTLDELDYVDLGDLVLPLGSLKDALSVIRLASSQLLERGQRFMAVGGEHLITYPLVQSMAERYPDLVVVHIDAHADLRQEFTGTPLSHATVMRRVVDVIGPGRLFQVGVRSAEEDELRKRKGFRRFTSIECWSPFVRYLVRSEGVPCTFR